MTVLRTAELRLVTAHIDSLSGALNVAQTQLLTEQNKLNELIRFYRADQQARFGDIEKALDELKKSFHESQTQLSQIDQKTVEIKKKWEEKARMDSLLAAQRQNEVEETFEKAYNDFKSAKFAAALQGMDDFMRRFPDAPHVEDALFFSAECLFVQASIDSAELRYKGYIRKYPEGKRLCETLYKLGLLYERAKKNKARDIVWEKLTSQCPDSEFAKTVKSRK